MEFFRTIWQQILTTITNYSREEQHSVEESKNPGTSPPQQCLVRKSDPMDIPGDVRTRPRHPRAPLSPRRHPKAPRSPLLARNEREKARLKVKDLKLVKMDWD